MGSLRIDWPDASAEALEGATKRLREAGRRLAMRPREDVLAALGEVLEHRGDAASSARRSLASELPEAAGFSREVVDEGLARGLASWNRQALDALVERELAPIEAGGGARVAGFELTSVLLAGSIPMPTLLSMLLPLALGSPVLARPGSRDRVTAKHVARSIAEVDAELGRCIEIAAFAHEDTEATRRFFASPCVVATGSDETLARVRSQVEPSQRWVGYGHRLSIAVLGPGATAGEPLRQAASGLALDVALWDQLGCLSPVVAWIEDGDPGARNRVAEALADALADVATRLPRGHVDRGAAARFASERAEAEMRAATGRDVCVHGPADGSFAVVGEDGPAWRAAPLHRFVRVQAVPDREALHAALRPVSRHLAAAAVGGYAGAALEKLAYDLASLGISRVCPPGHLQAPPLGWHHDGGPLLLPLARVCDFEA